MEFLESATKEILWHKMRDDLKTYIPDVADTNLLMCCCCGRFLPFSQFSLEHIIPKQSLKDDPKFVRDNVFANVRSGNILLCQKELKIKGQSFYRLGCNSFKGRNYDTWLRQVFNRTATAGKNFHTGHHVALVAAAYLAMFAKYGYQVVLTSCGIVTRSQFFNPTKFINEFPLSSQMILMGEKPTVRDEGDLSVWEKPFSFGLEREKCFIAMRGLSVCLPLSRDPSIPIARTLPFTPSRYTMKPDFRTVFE